MSSGRARNRQLGIELFLLIGIVVLLCCLSNRVAASTTNAPAHIQKEIAAVRLAGQGVHTWFGLKIYDASFWVGPTGYKAAAPAAAAFALDLRYARDLEGARIAEASVKEMEKLGLGSAQQHEAWLVTMKDIFPDVKAGWHLTGVFLPEKGARFYLDGKLIGEVPDRDFARYFFAIWLDPRTSDKRLRAVLLGDPAAMQ